MKPSPVRAREASTMNGLILKIKKEREKFSWLMNDTPRNYTKGSLALKAAYHPYFTRTIYKHPWSYVALGKSLSSLGLPRSYMGWVHNHSLTLLAVEG